MSEISGVKIKPLRVIHEREEGYLFETLRTDDDIFDGKFGQNLVSVVNYGIIKGLHRHKELTEYITCIKGDIRYVLIKEEENSEPIVEKYDLGDINGLLIKTPPGIWHGFTPLNGEKAIVLYTMDKPYDPREVDQETKDPLTFGNIWQI
jgi:dTDP-4-dehydrorhamnose 3,5-epimerase